MRKAGVILFMLLGSFLATGAVAQPSDTSVIRQLEQAEKEAIHKGDTARLIQLMSPDIVVHNPEHSIVGLRQIIDRIKGGKINYASFDRRIDSIAFIRNIAVVMGQETLVPWGTSGNAGKTVKRRFTNVWMKEEATWKLVARQATIISVD